MNPNDNLTVSTNVINHPVISPEPMIPIGKLDSTLDELNSPSNESNQSMEGVPFQIIIKNFSGNQPLSPIIHIRPEGVPLTIPRQQSSDHRKYSYNCSIYSPTSSISFTHKFISENENAQIKIIEKLNSLKRMDTITATRVRFIRDRRDHASSPPLPPHQVIARGACRGNKQNKQQKGCDIEFIWIRTNKYISLMIL